MSNIYDRGVVILDFGSLISVEPLETLQEASNILLETYSFSKTQNIRHRKMGNACSILEK